MKKIIIKLLLKEVTRLQKELESANQLREQDRDIRIAVCQENDKLKESISIWSNDETKIRVKLSEQLTIITQLKEKIAELENAKEQPTSNGAILIIFDKEGKEISREFLDKELEKNNHYTARKTVLVTHDYYENNYAIMEENKELKEIIENLENQVRFEKDNNGELYTMIVNKNKEIEDLKMKHTVLASRNKVLEDLLKVKKDVHNITQWKNSVKDGVPNIKVGEFLIHKFVEDSNYTYTKLSDDAMQKFIPVGGNFDYFIIPKQ